jgi:hypothetical protein
MATQAAGIGTTPKADQSIMPIECTAIGACSEARRRKYRSPAGLTQMDSEFGSIVGLRRAMQIAPLDADARETSE